MKHRHPIVNPSWVVTLGFLLGAAPACFPNRVHETPIGRDSVSIVIAAANAFYDGELPEYRLPLRVEKFTRDSIGIVVTFFPITSGTLYGGGGGRVLIKKNGRAVVLERFR